MKLGHSRVNLGLELLLEPKCVGLQIACDSEVGGAAEGRGVGLWLAIWLRPCRTRECC